MGDAKRKAEMKKEKFEKNPEKFVDMDTIVFAYRVDDLDSAPRLSNYVNLNHAQHFLYCIAKLQRDVHKALDYIEFMQAKEAEKAKKIITPGNEPGGIMEI